VLVGKTFCCIYVWFRNDCVKNGLYRFVVGERLAVVEGTFDVARGSIGLIENRHRGRRMKIIEALQRLLVS
jgi:hypothetical protein